MQSNKEGRYCLFLYVYWYIVYKPFFFSFFMGQLQERPSCLAAYELLYDNGLPKLQDYPIYKKNINQRTQKS